MRYCKRCVMPDSRPGLKLDRDGVCQACKRVEKSLKKSMEDGNLKNPDMGMPLIGIWKK